MVAISLGKGSLFSQREVFGWPNVLQKEQFTVQVLAY